MLDLHEEFAKLGFEEDETPERAKQNLVIACYDAEGRYLWGSECKTFMELQKLCEGKQAGSPELLAALKGASKTLKDGEWTTPSHP